MNEKVSVLQVDNLSVAFSMYNKGLSKRDLEVIHELSIDVKKGEIVAVVGSSGSGKSLLAHAIMGILPENAKTKGCIKYYNDELNEKYLRKVRGKDIAFIPQSVDFLDPLMKVGKQVVGINGNKERQKEVFKKYNLDDKVAEMYPFQLSGGMARNRTTITRHVSQVNSAMCQGCGACTVACPSGAMDLQGFSNKQILAEVDSVL